jgi:hypothetical protein
MRGVSDFEEEMKKGSYAGELIGKIVNLHGDWL